jgi:hypothetical protein
MTSRVIFYAVNSTLQDIRSHLPGGDCAFGGIPTILGGDFQQTLPIVPHGNRADSVRACDCLAKTDPSAPVPDHAPEHAPLKRIYHQQKIRCLASQFVV